MASELSFIEEIADKISLMGDVRFRKMFGEYLIYLNDKPIFLICDNVLYVKKFVEVASILGENIEEGIPYGGAKPHYIVEETANGGLLCRVAGVLFELLPIPKKRRKK